MSSKNKIWKKCNNNSSRQILAVKNLLKNRFTFWLKLIVTGSHLHEKFGSTKKFILKDKIKIFKNIKIYDKEINKTFNETYILKQSLRQLQNLIKFIKK